MTKKPRYFYAVRRGRTPGLFLTWDDCKKQIDGVSGADFKRFTDGNEALAWLTAEPANTHTQQYFMNQIIDKAKNPNKIKPARKPAAESAVHVKSANQKKTPAPDYIIYTDGSCLRNPSGPGGWAVVCRETATNQVTEKSDGEVSTTNNRMELTAAIEALSMTPDGATVDLYTDSQYLINGITKWVPGWKKRGWKRANGEAVLNPDLWQTLDTLYHARHVTFHWVRGHVGNPLNERCDTLAKGAAKRYGR